MKALKTISTSLNCFFQKGPHNVWAIIVYILLLFAVACKKDNKGDITKQKTNDSTFNNTWTAQSTAKLYANVYVVDSIPALKINLIAADSVSLTFKTSTENAKLRPRNILVSGPNNVSPYGFLRRIESVQIQPNGSIICITSQANLTDAVQNGTVKATITSDQLFNNPSVNNTGKLQVLGVNPNAIASASFSQDISLTHDFGVGSLSGDMGFGTTITAELDIINGKVTKFHVDLTSTKTLSLTVKAEKSFSGDLHYQYGIPLKSIVLDIGVPVTFKASLLVTMGIKGNASEEITANVVNKSTDVIGCEFQNGTWKPIRSDQHSTVFQTPQSVLAASVTPYASLDINLSAYGITKYLASSSVDLISKVSLPIVVERTTSAVSMSANLSLDASLIASIKLLDQSVITYTPAPLATISDNFFTEKLTTPSITTTAINAVTATSASSGGNTINNGGLSISQKGFVWNTSSSPTTSNFKTTDGSGDNSFTSILTNLAPNTRYYGRAYAVNSLGTSYGNELTFVTTANFSPGGSPQTLPPSSPNVGSQPPGIGVTNPTPFTAIPAIGYFTNCVTKRANAQCSSFTDGEICVRVVNINQATHQVIFEAKKCDGTSFNSGGYARVGAGLCGAVSYSQISFSAGQSSFQIPVYESQMSGSKQYFLYILQGANNNILFDAPVVTVNF